MEPGQPETLESDDDRTGRHPPMGQISQVSRTEG